MKPKVGFITFSIAQEISPLGTESEVIITDYAEKAENILKREGLDVLRIEKFIKNKTITQEVINNLKVLYNKSCYKNTLKHILLSSLSFKIFLICSMLILQPSR